MYAVKSGDYFFDVQDTGRPVFTKQRVTLAYTQEEKVLIQESIDYILSLGSNVDKVAHLFPLILDVKWVSITLSE